MGFMILIYIKDYDHFSASFHGVQRSDGKQSRLNVNYSKIQNQPRQYFYNYIL